MRKISGLLLAIPLLVLAIVGIPVGAQGMTTISIEPGGTVDIPIGGTFSVDVAISDVKNLGGYEFKMSYDTSLLQVDDVTVVTDWFGPTVKVWKKTFGAGLVWLIVTLPLGTVIGVDGSGTVATIDLTVNGEGLGVLDLHSTLLGDPWANPIMHQVSDGVFANVPLPQLWIKDKGAQGGGMWPEWHVAAPGTEQTLYARIVNTGDFGCYIKVQVSVYSPEAGAFSPINTEETWIPPKAAHNVTVTVSATFPDTSTEAHYYVKGAIYFSLDQTLWVRYSALEAVIGGRGETRDVPGNDATKFKTQG